MAVASWDSVATPELAAPSFRLPRRSRPAPIPRYPAGRHRGARTSRVLAFLTMFIPRRGYRGRHRPSTSTYAGRHTRR